MNKGIIIIIIISLLIGYSVGFTYGSITSLNWAANKAMHFLELKGIEIEFDSDEIAWGLYQFKNNINACYPDIKNASIYANERNQT